MAEGSSHRNTPALFKKVEEESSTGTEGSDDDSDTPLDLSWKTREATADKVQNNMQCPMAGASSHVSSKCGKTLEHSHLIEKSQAFHRPDEAQHNECTASLKPMTERHQRQGEHKDSLTLAAAQLQYDSLVSTEGGQHSCQLCTYVTKHKRHMHQHLRTHTGERPFQCSECASSFADKSNLSRHMRIHRGERPFSCLRCHASFTASSALVRHIRIHTGERPFSCVHCDASFTRNSSLVRHIRIHTGERPFSCVHCRESFSRKDHLISHMSKCGANKKR